MSTAMHKEAYMIIYPALGLAGETGEVVEKIKKMIRDDGAQLTEERQQLLKKELGDVLWYVAALASDLGLTLEEIGQHNGEKLRERMSQGLIQGDGDTREEKQA